MRSQLTTLCYIEKENQYLMLHRISKENDINKGKWIGVGGHFEADESPEECLLREVKEETGLTLTFWRYRGIVTFISEGNPAEYMFLYTADGFEGELTECREGKLQWIEKDQVELLPLWDGDRLFLELLRQQAEPFSLKLCYRRDSFWYYAALNGKELELLDPVDENGTPTGHVRERSMVHRSGERHRTVHIWVIRKRRDGGIDVLLQKRSRKKDSYPGYYDISAAGHVLAGDELEPSAYRELEEELGIHAPKGELRLIGFHEGYREESFWGQPFRDREISAVYLYEHSGLADSFRLQEQEVEEVVFMDYEQILAGIHDGSLRTCIYPEELQMLKKKSCCPQ